MVELVPFGKEAGEFLSSLIPAAYCIFVTDIISSKLLAYRHFASSLSEEQPAAINLPDFVGDLPGVRS